MTGIKLAIFSIAAGSLPIAQTLIPATVSEGARTLEQSSPTFVLAAIAIIFAWALIRASRRIDQLTDERIKADKEIREQMISAIKENTSASIAVKTVVDECHRLNWIK